MKTAELEQLKRTAVLLRYSVEHNAAHADELADLLDQLPEKLQRKLLLAIGSFEAANVELEEVLQELKQIVGD